MDSVNQKISFIPKGSLVREESFFERRRPRSAMGFIAILAFTLSASSYAFFSYSNTLLNADIAEKTIEIKKAQKAFTEAPEVGQAKIFRARADLASALLNAHTVASPVFAFLSKNTTESILYDKFSFQNGLDGQTIELSGEAPTYAALAYQVDTMRRQTKALSSFSVRGVTLTQFGSVAFSFGMSFTPGYLLYTRNLSTLNDVASPQEGSILAVSAPVVNVPVTSGKTSVFSATTTSSTTTAPSTSARSSLPNNWVVAPRDTATSSKIAKPAEKQSVLMSLWTKFKFW